MAVNSQISQDLIFLLLRPMGFIMLFFFCPVSYSVKLTNPDKHKEKAVEALNKDKKIGQKYLANTNI